MTESSPVQVFVVKFHNPTSGKGGYHLLGVYWSIDEAQQAIAKGPLPTTYVRRYTIHRFSEQEQIPIATAAGDDDERLEMK